MTTVDVNIYKDQMQKAFLFGTAVLYSDKPIPQEDVPKYWSSYDLRGTDRQPDRPYALVDQADHNYAGSILSPLPLKKDTAQSRLVKDKLELTGKFIRLTDFCDEYLMPMPKPPIRHMLRPASPDEAGLFYALEPEEDGREALRKAGATDEVFEMLDGFIDYERLGQAMMESDGVCTTSFGMIRCPDNGHIQQEFGGMCI